MVDKSWWWLLLIAKDIPGVSKVSQNANQSQDASGSHNSQQAGTQGNNDGPLWSGIHNYLLI